MIKFRQTQLPSWFEQKCTQAKKKHDGLAWACDNEHKLETIKDAQV